MAPTSSAHRRRATTPPTAPADPVAGRRANCRWPRRDNGTGPSGRKREHDAFTAVLRDYQVRVHCYSQLLAETVALPEGRAFCQT